MKTTRASEKYRGAVSHGWVEQGGVEPAVDIVDTIARLVEIIVQFGAL